MAKKITKNEPNSKKKISPASSMISKPGQQNPSLLSKLESLDEKLGVLADAEVAKGHHQPWPASFVRGVNKLENSWPIRAALSGGSAVALLVFALTVWSYYEERTVRAEERIARQQESQFRRQAQLSTAWATLLTPVGGNTGKAAALEILLSNNNRLVGVDLSCKNIGSYSSGQCKNRAIFDFDRFSFDQTKLNARFEDVNFEGNTIIGLKMDGGSFYGVNFQGVSAYSWKLKSVDFGDSFSSGNGLRCVNCSFEEMHFEWRDIRGFENAKFSKSVVVFPFDAGIQYVGIEDKYFVDSGENFIDPEYRILVFGEGETARYIENYNNLFSRTIDVETPPLFVRENAYVVEGGERYGELSVPAIERIFWDLYGKINICSSVETIIKQNLSPPKNSFNPALFQYGDGAWATRDELAKFTYPSHSICGYSLEDDHIKEALLSNLRLHFSETRFSYQYGSLIAFECEDDFAVVYGRDEGGLVVRVMEEYKEACIIDDGWGY